MKYIETSFTAWKEVNEQRRSKQTIGSKQRVIGISIDNQSFKLKIINDRDVLDQNGKLSPKTGGWLIDWVMKQPAMAKLYSAAKDTKTNFILYSVKADNKRKQVITFTITPRAGAEGLPPETIFVEKNELASLVKNQADINKELNILKAAESNAKTPGDGDDETSTQSKIKLKTNLPLTKINTIAKDSELFNLIKQLYIKMLDQEEITALPFFVGVKTELRAGKLGENTLKFLNGMIAGFDLRDEYRDLETRLTQVVVDKLATVAYGNPVNEAETAKKVNVFKDFNLDAFLKVVNTKTETEDTDTESSDTDTEGLDIGVPKEGLSQDNTAPGDKTLKQIQELIIKVFSKKLNLSKLFRSFKEAGATGNYDGVTEKMIAALKAGYGFKDADGKTISVKLLKKISYGKLDESYIGLDYMLVEQFDMKAYSDTASTYKSSAPATEEAEADSSSSTESEESSSSSEESSESGAWSRKVSDDELAKGASNVIVSFFSKESETFKEAKGTLNDDEDKGIEIFNNKFIELVSKPFLKNMNDADPNKNTITSAAKGIKSKMAGGKSDDTYRWSVKTLDGDLSFSVDTDF